MRRRFKTKLILLAIIALLFLYWRGITKVSADKGWNCSYNIVYAVCDAKNNKAKLPGLWDIFKAGTRF